MEAVVRKSPAPGAPGLSRAAVEEMVKEAEARGEARTKKLLAAAEKRHEMERATLIAAMEVNTEYLLKKVNNLVKMTASVDPAGAQR
jgi:hypothetical protein